MIILCGGEMMSGCLLSGVILCNFSWLNEGDELMLAEWL